MAKVLSIEFNNRSIKIIEGSKNGNSLLLYRSIYLNAPLNSIDDGNIVDMDAVVDVISNALTENKLKTKNAIFTISTNSIITRNLELPLLKSNSETMSMIKNELDNIMPIDLDEYKIKYKKTEIINVDGVEKGKYMVYGLPVKIYDEYLQLAEKLKLDLLALDLSFNSLDKLAKHKITVNKQNIKSKTFAFINFGYSTVIFSAVNDGISDFSRISSNGVHEIVKNYSFLYGIGLEESLKEIETLSLVKEDDNESQNINVLEEGVAAWVDEFSRYIRYYNSNNKDRTIEKIYIYGTFANIKGLAKYLSSHLHIETEVVDEISGITLKNNKNLPDFDAEAYLNAILSLYIDKKDINFLTDKQKKHKIKFKYGVIVMALVLGIVLTGAYHIYSYMVEKMSIEKEIANMDEYINNPKNIKLNEEAIYLKNKIDLMEKYKEEINKLESLLEIEDVVTSTIFNQVKMAQPVGTNVNSMSIDKSNIQLQCNSVSRQEVAQFQKNLKEIEFIEDVHIPGIVENQGEGNIVYSYTIVCSLGDVIVNEAE